MESTITKYGKLTGIVLSDYYPDGSLRECTVNCLNKLMTSFGELIPQYSNDEPRRKYTKSLSFYPNGDLKSISLHKQTPFVTPAGTLPAELVTFYENDRICRLFPLNGNLTGFWSEANEYELACKFHFKLTVAEFERKIIGIHFYESGTIQSMTFWPKDSLTIRTPIGEVPIRIGFSLYPDGNTQSFEPLYPLPIKTAIGEIKAFDLNANGISGDSNSVCFTSTGELQSLITSSERIVITDRKGHQIFYEPGLTPNICNEQKLEPVPLTVEFSGNGVRFPKNGTEEYSFRENTFMVQSMAFASERLTDQCSGYEE